MKNAIKMFGNPQPSRQAKVPLLIIAIVAIIGFTMAGCKGKSNMPSGTYGLTGAEAWTITFGQNTFTMFVPAQFAPSETDTTTNGTFTVSGKMVTLTGLAQPMTLTITNATTLTEGDGSVWKKK